MPTARYISRRQRLRLATKPRKQEEEASQPPSSYNSRSVFFRRSAVLIFLALGCIIQLNRIIHHRSNNFRLMYAQQEAFLKPETTDPTKDAKAEITTDTETSTDTKAPMNPNRTLAIIMGNFRGGEQAWKSLATNVLDPSSADLAMLIPENDQVARNSSLYQRAKYVWTFHDYEDWGDAIDLIQSGTVNWREELLEFQKGRKPSIFGGVKGEAGSGAIIMMLRWFLQNHIRGNDLTDRYDRFMITRSDHYYQCEHNISQYQVGGKNLWIPDGQDNFSGPNGLKILGFTDRYLIAGSEDVLDALDIYPTYFKTGWMKKRKNIWNTENLVKLAWRQNGMRVNHFPRVMFTCATKDDTSLWGTANKPAPGLPGLFLKYPLEHRLTQDNCMQNIPKYKG